MEDAQQIDLGRRLRRERERRHWTQEYLAEQIQSSVPSINRWEHGKTTIRQDAVAQLVAAFGKPPERWGIGYWHVPFLRNPYFTGRDQLLLRLHRTLTADKTVALSQTRSISGLGGIGKTQTALEYAYRYANEYEAVLWVRADSREAVAADFVALVQALDLPEKEEADQLRMIAAVKRWLEEHSPWLMVFDNADDVNVIADFLPRLPVGARLLTTRSQIAGMHIKNIEMTKMSLEEGLAFLLRRIAASEERDVEEDHLQPFSERERQAAQELWEMMDGLPLALDQAGAYINAVQVSLADYVDLYRSHRNVLLGERGEPAPEHPDAVATTWSLSFQQVEQKNPAAAELLRLCAFLASDAIPEEIIIKGAAHFPSALQQAATSPLLMNKAIMTLGAYSLMQRDAEGKTLTIHRLVQAVLSDTLEEPARRTWAERALRAVDAAFPEAPFQEWTRCEYLLPHVLVCAAWVEQEQTPTLEASSLFDKAGSYLRERGQYKEAKRLLEQALSIREQHPEAEHLLATSLSNLAGLLSYQGKYAEAEQFVQRALSIRERIFSAEHPATATSLSHLAILYTQQGKHTQAEPLYQRVLAIYEQHLGANHPEIAKTLNNLAVLYEDQGKYRQAEQVYARALAIYEQSLEPQHLAIARNVGNLALLSYKLGRYEQAKALYARALSMQEAESPDAAYVLYGLAEVSREQGEYEQAERLYRDVLAIRERHLEADHPDRAEALQGLADVCREQQRSAEAEQRYQQALSIWEQQFGPESLPMTRALTGLAKLAQEQRRYAEAEHLYQRALLIFIQSLNPQHPEAAETMRGLAQLREAQGNSEQARDCYTQALAIREEALGAHHPKTIETRQRCIDLLHAMGLHEDAARLEATQAEQRIRREA